MSKPELTAEERRRFADWLEQDASTTLRLIEQMKKINVPQLFVKNREYEAECFIVVARHLRNIHEDTIR